MTNYPSKIIALSAILLFMSACSERIYEEKPEEIKVTISEFVSVTSDYFGGGRDINNLTVSRDGHHVYLSVDRDKKLYHASHKDLEKGWTNLSLSNDLPNDQAGLANLKTAYKVIAISPAKDGALVSVLGKEASTSELANSFWLTNSKDNGAFYLSGTTTKAAWASSVRDMNALAMKPFNPDKPHRVAPGAQTAADKIFSGAIIYGALAVGQDGRDVPYFWSLESETNTEWIGLTKANLDPGPTDGVVLRARSGFLNEPRLVSSSTSPYLFAVTDSGLTTLPLSDVGAASLKNFPYVEEGDLPSAKGTVGSGRFEIAGSQTGNGSVTALLLSGNELYIGFNVDPGNTNADQGGVAIYHIKSPGTPPTVSPPDPSWAGVAILGLIKNGDGHIFAVTKNDILELEADGKKGGSYFDMLPLAPTDYESAKKRAGGYNKKTLPNSLLDNIKSAAFVGDKLDKLIVNTNDSGLMIVNDQQQVIPRPD